MIVVIDVSGVMEIILQKEKAEIFDNILEKSTVVIAPDLYVSELTNTLWKYYTNKIYNENECIEYIQEGIGYIDKFFESKEIWQEALSEGINNKHSIYDMFYMVTARRNNGILLTNDSVLAEICMKNNVRVC